MSVKILYCKDENGNVIYFEDVEKGLKYFCLDCEDELIVKDGDINIKHLAHKHNLQCESSGESFIHNHYKKLIGKKGMKIKLRRHSLCGYSDDYAIIKEVLNEVSLKKRYGADWDNDIIADLVLETNKGDIIVEIFYKHKKSDYEYIFKRLKPFICDWFEVKVSDSINDTIVWANMFDIEKTLNRRKHSKSKVYINGVVNPKYISYSKYNTTDVKIICDVKVYETKGSIKILNIVGNVKPELKGKIDITISEDIYNLACGFSKGKIKLDNNEISGNSYDYKDTIRRMDNKAVFDYNRKVWISNIIRDMKVCVISGMIDNNKNTEVDMYDAEIKEISFNEWVNGIN